MAKDEAYLSSKDVAYILDCSRDEVVELTKKKKLTGKKVGRFWRFSNRDVMAYAREQAEREEAQRRSVVA